MFVIYVRIDLENYFKFRFEIKMVLERLIVCIRMDLDKQLPLLQLPQKLHTSKLVRFIAKQVQCAFMLQRFKEISLKQPR